jgi:hypothetical protein
MKIHTSGFHEEKADIERLTFAYESETKFGIKIDPSKMKYDDAKRTLDKLCLNSLWGSFALRITFGKTIVTESPYVLILSYLDDPTIDLTECTDFL